MEGESNIYYQVSLLISVYKTMSQLLADLPSPYY